MEETVLVTGATGFVGRALTARLEASGCRVLRMSRTLGYDVSDPSAFDPFLNRGIRTVYHLAARTFVPGSWEEPGPFYATNVLGTQRTLEFCRQAGARLLYLSSYVYGPPLRIPIDEHHRVLPTNPYAHSKWLGEELCRFWLDAWGVPVAIARPFNAYGPGQSTRFLIPSIIGQWIRDGVVRVHDLAPRRDFVYLDDVVSAIMVVSEAKFDGAIYNIGSGHSSSVRDVIDALERVTGRPVRFEETGPQRADEIPEVVAACRLVREGRWSPATSLEAGLERMLRAEVGGGRR